ncbi:MAG: response regulator [SAR324 cluster bacterium]|nr:response regulator [SAR324 cluster bacterium]
MNEHILLVDDQAYSLDLLTEFLSEEGYRLSTARDGMEALEILKDPSNDFKAVLLDRNMPKMDGLEALKQMKKHDHLKMVPVIFQTSMSSEDDIREGMDAGAYYYLAKGFERDTLLTIVKSAISDYKGYVSLQNELEETIESVKLMESAAFKIRVPHDAYNLVKLLAHGCPNPKKAAVGLIELLLNGIEHGNLGFSYDEKKQSIQNKEWQDEVKQRLELPENITKTVSLDYTLQDDEIHFLIKDQGEGFDWKKFLEFDPERLFDPNGRGIAMAHGQCFDELEYRGKGNEVLAVIKRVNKE